MKATGAVVDISHITDDTPIDLYQIEVLHRLQTEGPMSFERVFDSRASRVVMVGLFLALLELIREKLVWVEQSGPSAPIYLKPLTEELAQQAVQKAILATAAEANNIHSAQTGQRPQPPIPIAEVPQKTKPADSSDKQEKIESREGYKQ